MIARWWGYTPQQWADLPPEVRAEKRHTVIWAPAAHADPNRSPQTNIDPSKGQP
jgi:hypothetical protein